MGTPKKHAGFRFTPALLMALDAAAQASNVHRTTVVERWLIDRATAEGWMEREKETDDQPAT